jgi:hypothetical protein
MANDFNEVMVDVSSASPEQLKAALDLLNKKLVREKKIEAGIIKGEKKWADLTPEEKERQNVYNRKRTIYTRMMLDKAEELGITVSDEEVEAEYQKRFPATATETAD